MASLMGGALKGSPIQYAGIQNTNPISCKHVLEAYPSKADLYCVKCSKDWSNIKNQYATKAEQNIIFNEGLQLSADYARDGLMKLDFEASNYPRKPYEPYEPYEPYKPRQPALLYSSVLNCIHRIYPDRARGNLICLKCRQPYSKLAKYYSLGELMLIIENQDYGMREFMERTFLKHATSESDPPLRCQQ
jgi:hypothetical protein